MSEGGQAGDVGDAVAGPVAGAKGWAADIDGIGAVFDGFDAEIGILGRCEEFERVMDACHLGLVGKTWRKFFNIEFAQDGFGAFAGIFSRSTTIGGRF